MAAPELSNVIRAVDLSFGSDLAVEDPDRFRAWCEARLANGDAEMLVVNCWTGAGTPLGAEEALRIAREAGLLTAGYCAVHDGRAGEDHVLRAWWGAGAEEQHLRFMAIDCEEIAGVTLSASTIADALKAVEDADQRPMIYTRASYWRNVQGNTDLFAGYPLWECYFDGDADLHGAAFWGEPFGGWEQPVGKQYVVDVPDTPYEIDGVRCDLNVFRRKFITGGGKAMPELTPDITNALDAARGWTNSDHPLRLHAQADRLRESGHPQWANDLESAANELSVASRVLDEAFGVGQ